MIHCPCLREPGTACRLALLFVLGSASAGLRADTHYVDANSTTAASPYTNWATAATVIQQAVDVSTNGDTVLVTNGVYAIGAREVYGTSNRVVVTKPVTVRSVNGPGTTSIVGYGPNGTSALRCAYLTNGALLAGFTLTNGATQTSGDYYTNRSGGGVWCESVSAVVSNCVLTGNSATWGGGAYSGTLKNCALTGNSADFGGGAIYGTLNNCMLSGNSAQENGGGAYSGTLNNCIVYYNSASSGSNYEYGSFNHCCTTPRPSGGTGNTSAEPQLASVWHLSAGSPCRGAGSAAYSSGVDIDGEPWANPPSIGCDEYWSGSVTGALSAAIVASFTNVTTGFAVDFEALIGGRVSASRWDFGDGTVVSNRPYASHTWSAAGDYLVELRAYNESHPEGVSAAVTIRVLPLVVYVSAASVNPVPPYISWGTAAQTIQEGVDAAAVGGTVWVTNGIYATGAQAVYGMSNRVGVTKPVTVRSVNGPEVTQIAGYQVPGTTNGAAAVRCVYLTNGAVLAGFTLTNGATQTSGDGYTNQAGGGVWCESVSAVVSNCVLTGNSAGWIGGGASGVPLNGGTLNNCTLRGNSAQHGGGAIYSTLNNCIVMGNSVSWNGGGAYAGTLNNSALTGNSADSTGGGAYYSTLNNCTLTGNWADSDGGGAYFGTLNNCIVYYNSAGSGSGPNYGSNTLNYCCTTPLPSGGMGNTSVEPQLANVWRLSAGSPCRGAGSTNYVSGVDIDGEPWANPPSIGCDEYWSGSVTGALSAGILASYTNVAVGFAMDFQAVIGGQVSASRWDFGDGTVVSNRPLASHAWVAAGDYMVELRAYNESHPEGVSAVVTIRVAPLVLYVSAASVNPVSPYISWTTAARSIQEAVDAAAVGGTVWVTNGIYATGAQAVYGMSNRVAVTKAVTVRSVNGPEVTSIVGYGPNGSSAVRCVYLTNGAILAGFTLTNGATQTSGDDTNGSGGGVWCESVSAVVSNCVLTGNSAYMSGGGAYSGTLNNCTLTGNSASSFGGGAYGVSLNNCALTGNWADFAGGGTYLGTLNNCTLTGNWASRFGGGASFGTLNNCIVYYNSAGSGSDLNYYYSTMSYCCTTPLPSGGTGNTDVEPQLASAWHLSASSPCRGAGSATYTNGVDIDGEPWANPPSIGCDEYRSGSVTGALSAAIVASYTNVAAGFAVDFQALIGGRVSASRWDFGDGTVVSNRLYASHAWSGAGDYVVELRAYNQTYPGGVAATVTVLVVPKAVHYVALSNATPATPYTTWATAASDIQAAVDVTAAGNTVLVTNGIYAIGARTLYGTSNRVAVSKPVTVCSVNGPGVTSIVGYGPNGSAAVRCVYLTSGAVLAGFTLTNGATQTSGDSNTKLSGGGVWCESVSAVVSNCVLTANSAHLYGGGAYSGTLNNCTLTGNSADFGGGAESGTLNNCIVSGNWASLFGGGASSGTLNNCALTGNSADSLGGGTAISTLSNCTLTGNSAYEGGGDWAGTLNNCIVYYNSADSGSGPNCDGSTLNYCCTTPMPASYYIGNRTDEPQLASAWHLSASSPCRGAGSATYTNGVDIDGEPWANPPSIGCDEYWSGSVTGALSAAILASYTNVAVGFAVDFQAVIGGRASASHWDFGGGVILSNQPYASHSWSTAGDYVVELRAYNENYLEGVAATVTVHVGPQAMHYVALNNPAPAAPYATWATAATNIQDAVDAVIQGGALVLVGDGLYEAGVWAERGMSNRVAVTKPLTVRSVNGPEVTQIAGYQVPGTTNGAAAVRCVYLCNRAVLAGFTLTNGATHSSEDNTNNAGGGVWCESVSAVVSNCVLTGNSAGWRGGGAYSGTINNCTITGNSAVQIGGGTDRGMLNNCTLKGNSANEGGGAFDGTLNNCVLTGNSASSDGGGVAFATLNNCTLVGNSAGGRGGGAENGTLNNCTLTGNSANEGGGAFDGTLNNCIIYYNSASIGPNYHDDYYDDLNYCCTTPMPMSWLSTNNLTNAPQFVNAAAGDYRLKPNSPCIDAGINQDWMFAALDLDGNPRILNGTVDMGAYETPFTLDLRAQLQGPYHTNSHAMTPCSPGSLPTTSPYAADPRTVSTIPSNVVDWVLIELRSTNGNTVIGKSAFLDTQGQVLSATGDTGITAEISADYYSIVVKHRNHLAVISAQPVAFTNYLVTYDFTTGADKYSGGADAAVQLESSVWGMIAGDADGDGEILLVDASISTNQVGHIGYLQADFDLDGVVSTNDLAIWTANQGHMTYVTNGETILSLALTVSPSRKTLLPGSPLVFSATGTTGAVNWAMVKNPSGGTVTISNDTSAVYQAGYVSNCVDVVEAWDGEGRIGRAYVNVISAEYMARAGKAIVIAGQKSLDDPLWPVTDYLGDMAYNTLLYRGFSKDNIWYLNPVINQDVDGNGQYDDISRPTTLANVAYTFTNWAVNPDQMFIYLVDHGGSSSGAAISG